MTTRAKQPKAKAALRGATHTLPGKHLFRPDARAVLGEAIANGLAKSDADDVRLMFDAMMDMKSRHWTAVLNAVIQALDENGVRLIQFDAGAPAQRFRETWQIDNGRRE